MGIDITDLKYVNKNYINTVKRIVKLMGISNDGISIGSLDLFYNKADYS